MAALLVFALLVGLSVGSFLNVVILRGRNGKSLGGRSRCESCAKTLGLVELIPILSFAVQKGRCRNCGTALLWQYPAVEAATALLFGFAAWFIFSRYPVGPDALYLLFLSFIGIAAGIVIFVSDLKYYLVPDGAVVALMFAGIGAAAFRRTPVEDLGGALALVALLGGLWFFSKGRWIGFGDVKLIFVLSLLVGFPASVAGFLFSFWLGAGGALVLLATGKKSWRDRMPFGPYILIGMALGLFFAEFFFELTGLGPLVYN